MTVQMVVSKEYEKWIRAQMEDSPKSDHEIYERMIKVGKVLNNQEFSDLYGMAQVIKLLLKNKDGLEYIYFSRVSFGYAEQKYHDIQIYQLIKAQTIICLGTIIVMGSDIAALGVPLTQEAMLRLVGIS